MALGVERVALSASVGVSLYPDDGTDNVTLLKAADTAMFQAKTLGRNRCCFYTQEIAVRAAERMGLEQGLRQALANAELVLHYQPQLNLVDGALAGVEALVRWQHPLKGIIPPDRFIPVAEEVGLIEPLGRWVLASACREAAAWRGVDIRLAVNVSARQFANVRFDEDVYAALAESGFPAERLEIEITESCIQEIEHSRKLLGRIKNLGVQIAIDDFGTGYSSLSVLKHLPIDRLKIDRSFIRDLPMDRDSMAITESICALSRTLGLRITAEGVETAAQLDVLRHLSCDEAQGYLFSKPVPAEQLLPLLNGARPWDTLFPPGKRGV